MPTITTVDAAWTPDPAEFTDAEARRFDTAMFLGDGSNNGVRGGIVRHGDSSLAVSVNGSDQVTVQAGAFVIPAATGLGVYRGALSAATAATAIATRNATNPRIDLVVIEATSTGAVVKTIEGTPGASPSAPALPAQHIELARLNVPAVAGGAVTVDNNYCAYAAALGGTLPVATAARLPGSGNQVGQRATAVDTGFGYRWSGTSWALTDGSATLTVAGGSGGVFAYARGGQASLVIDYTTFGPGGAAADDVIATGLPSGFTPAVVCYLDIYNTDTAAQALLRVSAGQVQTVYAIAGGHRLLGTVSYPIAQ